MTHYFLVDVETGGLDESRCSLLSVFGYLLDDELTIKEEISLLVKPDDGFYQLEAKAMEINAINIAEHDLLAITETEAANKLFDFFHINKIKLRIPENEKMVFAGHNPDLDKRFLKRLMKKVSLSFLKKYTWDDWFTNRVLDTGAVAQFMKLTRDIPKDCNGSLAQLCKFYGIPHVNAHDAKADVNMTLKVLKSMIEHVNQDRFVNIQPLTARSVVIDPFNPPVTPE